MDNPYYFIRNLLVIGLVVGVAGLIISIKFSLIPDIILLSILIGLTILFLINIFFEIRKYNKQWE